MKAGPAAAGPLKMQMPPNLRALRPASWMVGGAVLSTLTIPAFVSLGCARAPSPASETAVWQVRTVSPEEREAFLGSEACASCHPDAAAEHRHSQHARTLTRVDAGTHGDRFQASSEVVDPDRGLKYTTAVVGNRCVLITEQAGRKSAFPATLGFGSGKHATTYVGEFGDQFLELRLTHYSHAGKWDFSPGQQVKKLSGGVLYPEGLVKAPDVVEGCFVCHSSAAVKDAGRILPDRSLFGVGCESCHGPGRDHVEAVKRKDRDLRMARLTRADSQTLTALCNQCHRSPAGDDLHDPFNKSQLPRFQGLALAQSRCFINSEGRLTCLTCHDAHGDADRPQAEYNRQCGSCHTPGAPRQVACSLEPRGDCVPCHMPSQDVGMPTGLRYRNHWIKVWGSR